MLHNIFHHRVLPLHHIHGTVNALITPLFAGSTVEFPFPFNADAVWKRFAHPFLSGSKEERKRAINLAVPQLAILNSSHPQPFLSHRDLLFPQKVDLLLLDWICLDLILIANSSVL
jgi:hypothetical protein